MKNNNLNFLIFLLFIIFLNSKENNNLIKNQLEKGEFYQESFTSNETILIYSFNNSLTNNIKKDLLISITILNINCEIFLYKSLDEIKVNDNNELEGFLLRSNQENKIIMEKTNKNYISNDLLYIVIKKDEKKKNFNTLFYLGITDEDTPFNLKKNLEIYTKFNNYYYKQNFIYNLNNFDSPFILSLGMNYGKITINIYINDNIIHKNIYVYDHFYLKINEEEIKNNCKDKNECKILIYSELYSYFSAGFLLVCKRESDSPEYLTSNSIITRSILSGENHYFKLNAIPDPIMGIKINTYFNTGKGKVFVNIANDDNTNNFPNETNYQYSNDNINNNLKGIIISIPFEKLNPLNNSILLITIHGEKPDYNINSLEYSISYLNSLIEIPLNSNYQNYISSGEIHYFHFNINDIETKRLYISAITKEGEVEMFLNYDNIIPNTTSYNWKSKGNKNKYLDITKDDLFFLNQGLNEITGDYTLIINCISDTSYNVYVSDKNFKIMTIDEHYPAGCSCADEGDNCYFKYEINKIIKKGEVLNKEIIFFLEYTYGSGDMFGKLYENGDYNKIFNDLPNEKNYDYNNINNENYIKIYLGNKNEKYSKDSILLLNVKCKEKSLFDLNLINLITSEDIKQSILKTQSLDLNKDNIFYLKSNISNDNSILFSYYYSSKQNLNYHIKAYSGSAKIIIFTNNTYFDFNSKEIVVNYTEINSFYINEKDINTFSDSINNSFSNNYIIYKVIPETDCIFFIYMNLDNDWVKININKPNELFMKNQFFGYFDMIEDFEEIVLTIRNENPKKIFSVYTKMNVINNNISNILSSYNVPSKDNYDKYEQSNEILNQVSIKIDNIPKELRNNDIKLVRLLFMIKLDNYNILNLNEKINIMVYPNVNNFNRIKTEQNKYFFSSLLMNKTTSIFKLKNDNINNDFLVMHISPCSGDFDFSLSDKLTLNENKKEKNLNTSKRIKSFGKYIITLNDIKNIDYYLSVWGIKEDNINCILNPDENCETNIDFTFFYYLTKKENYYFMNGEQNYQLEYENISKGKIKIKIPELYTQSINGTIKKLNKNEKEYNLVISNRKEEFNYLESICYLSEKVNKNNKNLKNIKYTVNYDDNFIIVDGLINNNAYFMNVLMKDLKNNEIATFKPIQIIYFKKDNNYILFLSIFVIIILIIIIGIYYKKYKETKIQLIYEQTDIRNMGNLPTTQNELAEMVNNKNNDKNTKYQPLTEEIDNL